MCLKIAIFIIFVFSSAFVLSQEDELIYVEEQSVGLDTNYNIVLKRRGEVDGKVIWSKAVSPEDKGHFWATIVDYDVNDNGILVLLELNQWTMGLLQFSSDGILVAKRDWGDPGWLEHTSRGGRIALEAPNRVTTYFDGGEFRSAYFTPNGDLVTENGLPFEEFESKFHRLFDNRNDQNGGLGAESELLRISESAVDRRSDLEKTISQPLLLDKTPVFWIVILVAFVGLLLFSWNGLKRFR